jgi:hypothetical protein
MIALLTGLALAQSPADDAHLRDAVLTTRGRRGAVMVLWPRVVPHAASAELEATAGAVQRRLDGVVSKAFPLVARQLAPAPQRVCARPRGCKGPTVGVLIGQEGGGCVAVGWVGEPGTGPMHLVPLAGEVTLSASTLPFRAHPEDAVTIDEFVPCATLAGELDGQALVPLLRRHVR